MFCRRQVLGQMIGIVQLVRELKGKQLSWVFRMRWGQRSHPVEDEGHEFDLVGLIKRESVDTGRSMHLPPGVRSAAAKHKAGNRGRRQAFGTRFREPTRSRGAG